MILEAYLDGTIIMARTGLPDLTAVSTSRDPLTAAIIDDDTFVVAWWNGGTQVDLEYWILSSGFLALGATTTWVGASDITALVFDDYYSILYRMDGWNGVLQFMNWTDITSPYSETWNTVDLSTMPSLAEGPGIFAWIPDSFQPSGRYLFVGDQGRALSRYGVAIEGHPSAPTLSYMDLHRSFLVPDSPALDFTTAVEGSTSVDVTGPSGSTVEIEEVSSGMVMGTGFVPSNQYSTTVPLTSPLILGERYRARAVGQTYWGRSSVCVRCYPASGQSSSGLQFEPIATVPNVYIGNLDFQFSVELRMTPPPPATVPLSAFALAGLAGGSPNPALDPLILAGGNWIIDPSIAILAMMQGEVQTTGYGILEVPLPIANDPALEGQIVLIQGAVDDGTGLIVSDIIGAKILPAP